MGFWRKKPDPIAQKAKSLDAQIAAIEGQIQKLAAEMQRTRTQPHVRSTVFPQNPAPARDTETASPEPVFETVDHRHIAPVPEGESTSAHYNDRGLRKFDILAVWKRVARLVRGPSSNHPRLVHLLAAGSIRGVRPLRYEKRVARNRFIVLVAVFTLVLWVILTMFFRK